MKLSGDTKVHELLVAHPYLEAFLVAYHPKFEMLHNRMARATIGRVASLSTAAGIADLDLGKLLADLAAEVQRHTGQAPELAPGGQAPALSRAQRLEQLKGIIRDLHDGGDVDQARQRFSQAVQDVEATEIAQMEEALIRDGLPVQEVQRLCDVHVGAFRHALDQHAPLQAPAGHPVHTYVADNEVITRLATDLGRLAHPAQRGEGAAEVLAQAAATLEGLAGLESHYQRKENQLFPVLERHGVTGPSQVMWGVHDQIRAALKALRAAVAQGDLQAFAAAAPAAARDIVEMVYKEEKILFPLAQQTLTQAQWAEVRRGEDALGYGLARPAAAWPPGDAAADAPAAVAAQGALALQTGQLTLEQLNLLLTHLPVDLSFVDETDTVRFYSEGPERIFPRSPAVIGRKVQNCHPPKSVHLVQDILEAFRAGTQSTAQFWITLGGRFLHIRYFAVRDAQGAYRGCLEVSQDVTEIRALQGERRLLHWEGAGGQPGGEH